MARAAHAVGADRATMMEPAQYLCFSSPNGSPKVMKIKGTYTLHDALHNGRPTYRRVIDGETTAFLWFDTCLSVFRLNEFIDYPPGWVISSSDQKTIYAYSPDGSDTQRPPQMGWFVPIDSARPILCNVYEKDNADNSDDEELVVSDVDETMADWVECKAIPKASAIGMRSCPIGAAPARDKTAAVPKVVHVPIPKLVQQPSGGPMRVDLKKHAKWGAQLVPQQPRCPPPARILAAASASSGDGMDGPRPVRRQQASLSPTTTKRGGWFAG
jgi:hypothetical protein